MYFKILPTWLRVDTNDQEKELSCDL